VARVREPRPRLGEQRLDRFERVRDGGRLGARKVEARAVGDGGQVRGCRPVALTVPAEAHSLGALCVLALLGTALGVGVGLHRDAHLLGRGPGRGGGGR